MKNEKCEVLFLTSHDLIEIFFDFRKVTKKIIKNQFEIFAKTKSFRRNRKSLFNARNGIKIQNFSQMEKQESNKCTKTNSCNLRERGKWYI